MAAYLRKRIANFLLVMVGVSLLSFLLIALSGTDPAEVIARRAKVDASDALIEEVRVEMGLDQPPAARYFTWVGGLFTGRLGTSVYSFRPIADDLAAYFPTTVSLTGLALVWIVLLSVPVSLLCALHKDSVLDHITRVVTILGICMPTFWLGFLLLLGFAVRLPWFSVAPSLGLKGLILPSFALAFPVACAFIRLFRSALLTEMGREYAVFAHARGLSSARILRRHLLRNALPPMITLFCQYLGYLIAGGAVVENVFSLNGIGNYLIRCVLAADTTAVATCIVIIAAVFVLANLAGDIVNRLLCPWIVRETNG